MFPGKFSLGSGDTKDLSELALFLYRVFRGKVYLWSVERICWERDLGRGRAREFLGGKWQEVLPQAGRDGGHCSRVSSDPARRTPHMPPAGPI